MMKLAKQLKLFIAIKHESVSGLARKSGVSRDAIHAWLAGKQPRNLNQVRDVAQVLGTNVDTLCFGDGIDVVNEKSNALGALFGNDWVHGTFEIKIRKVSK